MMRDTPVIKGASDASRLRVGIIVSEYHASVTGALREGALAALQHAGASVDGKTVTIITVPGAFEIPLVARRAAEKGTFDALVCLGCVIRGETPHFEYVSQAAAQGLERVSLDSGIPVGFGVLTTDNVEQALARAGGDVGNRGYDAAIAAIETLQSLRGL